MSDDGFIAEDDDGFVPEAPRVQPAPASGPGVAMSSLQGLAQGSSFGFADELAGVGAGLRSLPAPLQMAASVASPVASGLIAATAPDEAAADDTDAVVRAYARARDSARQENSKAEAAHPRAHGVSQFVGALLTPGPKGMGAGRLAKQGAMYGSLTGAGTSDADVFEENGPMRIVDGAAPLLANTALGAGTGALLTPVASGLSGRFSRFLKNRSQENALKAVGAKAGIADALGMEGVKTIDDARALGQTAIDEGLVPAFSRASDVAQNTGFALEKQGARVAGVLNDADKLPGALDLDRAAWRATEEVMGPSGLTTEAMSKARPAGSIVDRILKQADVDPSFNAANRLKSDFYNGINYGTNATGLGVKLQKDAVRGLRKSIEEQVAEKLGPEAADELMAANKTFGALKKIEGLSSEEARRAVGRAGPLSAGTLAASLAAGSPAPMLMKAAEPFLPSTMSALQRNVSPMVTPLTQAGVRPAMREISEREEDAISAFLRSGG